MLNKEIPDGAKYGALTLVAILAIIGLLPVVVVSVGTVAVSSTMAAGVWLLARRYGLTPRSGGGRR